MNRGGFAVMMLLVLAQRPWAAEPTAGHRLLDALREQRQSISRDPSHAPIERPPIDLTALAGIDRGELLHSLGAPDYCVPDTDSACRHSLHSTYFFYRYAPPSVRDVSRGVTEITLQAGGGWALEIDWVNDRVSTASWVKQE